MFKRNNFKKMKRELLHRYPLRSGDIRIEKIRGMISVILPVYNCEKYLEEAVNSVLSQTYTNLELIIVDDGSTDNSGKIADSFMADDRVRVIHQKNMKLPKALNNGFGAARGEFLTWTSADNRMLPTCLEILTTELARDIECDMVYGNMRLIDENGNILRGYGWYEFPPLSGNVILPDSTDSLNTVANNTIGAAFLWRRSAECVLNGHSEHKFMLEDYDYFMRMNSLFSIRHTVHKKPIYEYRFHSDSLTAHDEELGITASRPALMELDKKRRSFYPKKMSFYMDGTDKALEKTLSKMANRVFSKTAADKLAEFELPNIFYVNCGNTEPTWSVPQGIPRFVVTDTAGDIAGYDVRICKQGTNLSDCVSPSGNTAIAAFMILRAKNDLLYLFETRSTT